MSGMGSAIAKASVEEHQHVAVIGFQRDLEREMVQLPGVPTDPVEVDIPPRFDLFERRPDAIRNREMSAETLGLKRNPRRRTKMNRSDMEHERGDPSTRRQRFGEGRRPAPLSSTGAHRNIRAGSPPLRGRHCSSIAERLERVTDLSAVLASFVQAVDRDALGAYGVHMLIGSEEAEHRWRSDDRENIYSVSKGICALAVGLAIQEGIASLESRVDEMLSDIELGPGVEDVTLRHLLSMSSGIDFRWFADEPVPWPDLAQEMLGRPTAGPGSTFQYSDASTYVAMRMLGAVVGDVRDWLMPRLFDPLGIENPQWHRCPLGWIVGGSGLQLRTHELAHVGRLLRDRGNWKGHHIVSPDWIQRMHDPWLTTGSGAQYERYGLAAWDGPGDCWRLDGRYGQYIVVDQHHEAVITITAHEETRDHLLAQHAERALRES
jgi:Beta-lactamase